MPLLYTFCHILWPEVVVYVWCSLVPRPTPLFVLQFVCVWTMTLDVQWYVEWQSSDSDCLPPLPLQSIYCERKPNSKNIIYSLLIARSYCQAEGSRSHMELYTLTLGGRHCVESQNLYVTAGGIWKPEDKLNPAASLVYSLFIQFTVINSGMCSSCYYT